MADYLAGEVLAHISEAERDLLLRTSISDPVPTPRSELSGRDDAADVLAGLERSTGLVVASGPHRTEFRFQELMRTYLMADLYRRGPGRWRTCTGRPLRGGQRRRRPVEACATPARQPTTPC